MKTWPKYPLIYEINTWVWLNGLGRKYKRAITLATVPAEELGPWKCHVFQLRSL